MPLFDTLQSDLNAARKALDKPRVLVLGTIYSDAKNRKIELRHRLRAPHGLAGEQGACGGHAPVLLVEPHAVGTRDECADPGRARRREGALCHQLEQSRKLEDPEGVRVHLRALITPACSTPRARWR